MINKPLKRKVEVRSIALLEKIINEHPTMDHSFKRMDKELSWDGCITVFQDDNCSCDKKNFDFSVPVQIKGHSDANKKYIGKNIIKASVSVEDLRNYFKNIGCLYFQIYINSNGTEYDIYYNSLYPAKLNKYLNDVKNTENRKTITIPFVKLSQSYIDLERICKQFAFEFRKQGSGLGQIVHNSINSNQIKSVKKINANTSVGKDIYDFFNAISTGDITLYGIIDDSGIEYPINFKGYSVSNKSRECCNVSINNDVYYTSFDRTIIATSPESKKYTRGYTEIIKLSGNLSLIIQGNSASINNFELNTDIFQLRTDARFLLSLFKEKNFYIGIEKRYIHVKKHNKKIPQLLNLLIQFGDMLEIIDLNLSLSFKDLDNNDKTQLLHLYRIYCGKSNNTNMQGLVLENWKFRGKYFPFFINYKESSCKILGSIFNNNIVYKVSENSTKLNTDYSDKDFFAVPNYVCLDTNILSNLYSYDYDSMVFQIDRSIVNDITINLLYELALKLILSYDSSFNVQILDLAEITIRKLLLSYPDDIMLILLSFQIEYRKKGKLSKKSIVKLKSCKHFCSNNPELTNDNEKALNFYKAVLCSNNSLANQIYLSLSDKAKCSICNTPIYSLYIHQKS